MTATVEARQMLAAWYAPFRLGGVETFLSRFAHARAGFAVAAVESLDGPMRTEWPDPPRVLDWTPFWPAFMREAPSGPAIELITESLYAAAPSVLSINDCVSFALGCAPLLRRVRRHCVVVDVVHVEPPEDEFIEHRLRYLDALDGLVATSRTAIERLSAASPRATKLPMRYIPYGVPEPVHGRTPRRDVLRLLFVGRLEERQKRVTTIPGILARLNAKGCRFAMTFVGDGSERAWLEREIESLGLGGSVQFAGAIPSSEVGRHYAEHDVLLNVSAFEGFPISIIEAMAAGCVPVLTNLPSVDRDVMRHGENCLLLAPTSPEDAAELLHGTSAQDLEQMSAAARETGRAFTVDRMVRAYCDFFEELMHARRVEPWPAEAPRLRWDVSGANPWLPAAGLGARMSKALRRLIARRGD